MRRLLPVCFAGLCVTLLGGLVVLPAAADARAAGVATSSFTSRLAASASPGLSAAQRASLVRAAVSSPPPAKDTTYLFVPPHIGDSQLLTEPVLDLDGDRIPDLLDRTIGVADYTTIVARSGRTGRELWRDSDHVVHAVPLPDGSGVLLLRYVATWVVAPLPGYTALDVTVGLAERSRTGQIRWQLSRTGRLLYGPGTFDAYRVPHVADVDTYLPGGRAAVALLTVDRLEITPGVVPGAAATRVQRELIGTGPGGGTSTPLPELVGGGATPLGPVVRGGPACNALTGGSDAARTIGLECGVGTVAWTIPFADSQFAISPAGDTDRDGVADLAVQSMAAHGRVHLLSGADGHELGTLAGDYRPLQADLNLDGRTDFERVTVGFADRGVDVRVNILGPDGRGIWSRLARLAQDAKVNGVGYAMQDLDGDGTPDTYVRVNVNGREARRFLYLTRSHAITPVAGTLAAPSRTLRCAAMATVTTTTYDVASPGCNQRWVGRTRLPAGLVPQAMLGSPGRPQLLLSGAVRDVLLDLGRGTAVWSAPR